MENKKIFKFSEILDKAHDSLGVVSPTMGSIVADMQTSNNSKSIAQKLALHWLSDVEMIRLLDKSATYAPESAYVSGHRQLIASEVYSELAKFIVYGKF